MKFEKEEDLERKAVPFLKERYIKHEWRVPLSNRIPDLAAIDEDGNLICIEFKLKDWKRALEQASINANSFDYVYVCVPGGKYLSELKIKARKLGVGVLIYNEQTDDIQVALEPEKVKLQWLPDLNHIKSYIMGEGESLEVKKNYKQR